MNKINFKCPQCGGNLDVDENREFVFCQFCGHKIMLDQMSKSELEINRMEHEETMKDKSLKEDKMTYIILGVVVVAVVVLMAFMLIRF